MKTLPLTTPEVRSILAGRKTRITLPVEPQPVWSEAIPNYLGTGATRAAGWVIGDDGGFFHDKSTPEQIMLHFDNGEREPPFRVGDVVGVKEEFNVHDLFYDDYAGGWEAGYPLKDVPAEKHRNCCVSYRADDDMGEWRAAADMPNWAIRLHLRVTSVSVYRVCRISEAEAIAEGFAGIRHVPEMGCWLTPPSCDFRREWQSKHPAYPFDSAWGCGIGFEVQQTKG